MIYVCELRIPANTLETAPARSSYPITAGAITKFALHWPWGAGNLAGVRALHNEFQYWPLSVSAWFNSTRRDLDFAEQHLVTSDDASIELEGYNLDDTFAHTVTVYIEVTRPSGQGADVGLWASLGGEPIYG